LPLAVTNNIRHQTACDQVVGFQVEKFEKRGKQAPTRPSESSAPSSSAIKSAKYAKWKKCTNWHFMHFVSFEPNHQLLGLRQLGLQLLSEGNGRCRTGSF
jgi:hypothetical protein